VQKFVRRAFLPKHLEAVNSGHVRQRPILRVQVRVRLQQHIRKACPEIRSVNIQMLLPWNVHFLALGAVRLNSASRKFLRKTNGQDELAVAQDSLAIAKRA
jgi:hypothetical protein